MSLPANQLYLLGSLLIGVLAEWVFGLHRRTHRRTGAVGTDQQGGVAVEGHGAARREQRQGRGKGAWVEIGLRDGCARHDGRQIAALRINTVLNLSPSCR